ncbi:MAG: N-formylglutamate deformylase [Gammaproteobacteria bacterium]|nr:N-formylglutamate deformylase [Gammaproteobacteria bacterium]
MIDVFSFHEGTSPLLISVPHDGIHVPPDIGACMTAAGAALPDTDWHVAELYSFARELGASMLVANYSRYVVDLNRPATDEALYTGQVATGLCPLQTFEGAEIYASGSVDAEEVAARVAAYWRPYHDKIRGTLERLRDRHGVALLWDAHSIASVVPRLFEGELPELNLGTNGGTSCAAPIAARVAEVAGASPYSHVVNGRFRGGYITRHYGDPEGSVHAMQLELAQRAYLNEATTVFDPQKASGLRDTLRLMLQAFVETAKGY